MSDQYATDNLIEWIDNEEDLLAVCENMSARDLEEKFTEEWSFSHPFNNQTVSITPDGYPLCDVNWDEVEEHFKRCSDCGEHPDECSCPTCKECDDKIAECCCDRCSSCEELEQDCDCEKCASCKEILDNCDCTRCDDCTELTNDCACKPEPSK